jgi:hypothetical protein
MAGEEKAVSDRNMGVFGEKSSDFSSKARWILWVSYLM